MGGGIRSTNVVAVNTLANIVSPYGLGPPKISLQSYMPYDIWKRAIQAQIRFRKTPPTRPAAIPIWKGK